MHKYELLVPAALLFAVFLPWRRRRVLLPAELIGRIPPDRFRGLDPYLNSAFTPCAEFWESSLGLKGIYQRMRHMTIIVRLLQCQIRSGDVSRIDAAYVWQQAALQIWFSLWALPESAVCILWDKMPHVCGLFALRAHWNLSLATITLCGTEGTHNSVNGVTRLL